MFDEYFRLWKRFKELRQQNISLLGLSGKAFEKAFVYLEYPIVKTTKKNEHFIFDSRKLPYYYHHYNATWRNERAIEIALALDFLERTQMQNWLELGNVLNYYTQERHTVVDKYEKRENIINEDIVNYFPGDKFDGFVSLSTFEHIGWDEVPKTPEKVLAALNRIRDFVTSKSNVFVSFPLGYNDFLDRVVNEKMFSFQKEVFYKRVNQNNHWIECSCEEALACVYGKRFPAANSLFIGEGLVF